MLVVAASFSPPGSPSNNIPEVVVLAKSEEELVLMEKGL
jgi:hypothetical protein